MINAGGRLSFSPNDNMVNVSVSRRNTDNYVIAESISLWKSSS